MALTDKLKAIGDAIRSKLGKTDLIPLSSMPDSIEDVYNKGVQDQYDLFWDAYQLKGTRKRYRAAFGNDEVNGGAHPFWTDETLRPKYSFGNVTNANRMFYQLNLKPDEFGEVNFMKYFSRYCPNFNFSLVNSTDNTYAFCLSNFTHLPSIDLRGGGLDNNEMCLGKMPCLIKVDEVVVDEYTDVYGILRECPELVDVVITGTIGQGNMALHKSTKLSKNSIISVVKALSAYIGMILSLEAVNKAFETVEGLNDGSTSTEWLALIATKPHSTISLV